MSELLKVEQLSKYFPVRGGWFQRAQQQLKAVDGISFSIRKGRTLGLVGESGCGKSTLGRAVIRLLEPTAGKVTLDGTTITSLSRQELFRIRREMQIIFQDPYASLSPRRTVGQTLLEPLETHRMLNPAARRAWIRELLEIVGLREHILDRYPHEFSGGQRQRVGIARALALKPKFIVADEAVSALDVSVQSQVLNLLRKLQQEFGISFLFISHDLAVVQHISDDVGVMYLGKLVEKSSARRLFAQPAHPYTRALMSAVPVPDPAHKSSRIILQGDVPSPIDPPGGCAFHTRCPRVMDKCSSTPPPAFNLGTEDDPHWVNCHLYPANESSGSKK